ncbi:hypothetical protein ABZ804_09135 [Streptomyces sp. NPDC047726]|uniref:hypothetical protein n=1 Tax=Streptomyces sp. NPDC047726 TaxID=3156651 RepID=UPI0033E2FB30
MIETSGRPTTLPGPTFAAGIQLSTAVHRGVVAQVLAFHVPASGRDQSAAGVTGGMQAIAASLGLGAHDAPPPTIDRCIESRRGTPFLDYGHPDARLALPVGAEWRAVAEAGGPIRIMILTDTLWPSTPGALAEHVQACYDRGAVRWGTTFLEPQ